MMAMTLAMMAMTLVEEAQESISQKTKRIKIILVLKRSFVYLIILFRIFYYSFVFISFVFIIFYRIDK
jgi:hypothetical protein